MIKKIKENIYSVGAVDENIKIFHGYEVPHGTTYNSYLIVDDEITLIDFVKEPFSETLIKNIKEIIGDKEIANFVCNHVEPDHSGALPYLQKEYPNAKIYGTAKCKVGLSAYYPELDMKNFITVKKDDNISLGKNNLYFIPAPMVHWPDSMLTYLKEEKILFSNDAFGQHLAVDDIWDESLDEKFLFDRVANYYANIVLPFGASVTSLIKNLSDYSFEIACPSHGVVLHKTLPTVLESYIKWSNYEVDEKQVVIVYDTMWGTTKKLAEKIEKEWKEKGFDVSSISLSENHYSHAMGKLIDAKYIFVGSPTLNNNVLPSVSAFLTYMKGLKPKNRIGKAFGSYGWSGESIGQINEIFKNAGFETLEEEKAIWNI